MTPIALVGLPTDRNSSFLRGPASAPAAIRKAMASEMGHMTAENGLDLSAWLSDRGDLALQEDDGDHRGIVAGAAAAFDDGPALFLGGDHYVTWPVLAGLKATRGRAVNVVHIDAHSDTYPDYEGNRSSHASPFSRALEDGLIASLTQVGVRTVNAVQQAQIDRWGVQVFGPDQVAQAIAALPQGETYISFDIDGLDPAFAPGVSHHEPGGLTVREALAVIRAVPGPVIGADVVEYNPSRDVNDMTAAVCVKLVKEIGARLVQG